MRVLRGYLRDIEHLCLILVETALKYIEVLGLDVRVDEGTRRFYDPVIGQKLLRHVEIEQARRKAEEHAAREEAAPQAAEAASLPSKPGFASQGASEHTTYALSPGHWSSGLVTTTAASRAPAMASISISAPGMPRLPLTVERAG